MLIVWPSWQSCFKCEILQFWNDELQMEQLLLFDEESNFLWAGDPFIALLRMILRERWHARAIARHKRQALYTLKPIYSWSTRLCCSRRTRVSEVKQRYAVTFKHRQPKLLLQKWWRCAIGWTIFYIRFSNRLEITLIHRFKRHKVLSPHSCVLFIISESFHSFLPLLRLHFASKIGDQINHTKSLGCLCFENMCFTVSNCSRL